MKAVKGNKEYSITDAEKKRYQNDGFDILDDDGNTIAYGEGKTVSYDKYQRVVNELEALKASASASNTDEFAEMTVEQLRAYAEEHQIEIGNASSQSGIAKKIREALKSKE